MVKNQEIAINLLEEEILLLEEEINIKLEKGYLKIENLKIIIKKISNNSISLAKISQKNKLERRLEVLKLIVERRYNKIN